MDEFLDHTEVFWVGVQALLALAALIGLFLYTLYTRRMMLLQIETRRAELTPVLSPRNIRVAQITSQTQASEIGIALPEVIPHHHEFCLDVRNIGKGTAVLCHAAYQQVTDAFQLGQGSVYTPGQTMREGKIEKFELLAGEQMNVCFPDFDDRQRWLFLISCADVGNGFSQLQILRERGTQGRPTWQMAHRLFGSRSQRFVGRVKRFVDFLRELDRITRKITEED